MDALQRKDAFLKDFQELLNKHDAEFEVSYGFSEGPGGAPTITMHSEYDHKNDVLVNEFVEFYLPSWAAGRK